ncbi:MAG: transketolase [Candidatus Tectomicrobia bacterium]|uniref:Transketolase n=1 Tax=Tectimicrobiota bacterium TaxID=2528274 RepID=A0A933LQ03_UNCTE|nr:transketolase [Candidatus Tectomicrobia bacterium]
MLSIDAVQKASSGHPGMPMGAAPMGYVLWTKFLKHNPANPSWPNRDRFVLSAGHGSMLLYSLLHLTGYNLPIEELKNFRQWESQTPGHPEYGLTPGVETTTGPLGQGFATAVGMAVAECYLAAYFNRPGYPIVDHYTYAIVSDGDLMEGVTSEAASLAAHLGLGKIILLYDDNHITIEGETTLAFTENVGERFKAYGWHLQHISDGNDLKALGKAIQTAQGEKERPSLIAVRTHIAFGSPNKQDSPEAHGAPLGAEEVKLTKLEFKWPLEPSFYIPLQALSHFKKVAQTGFTEEDKWQKMFREWEKSYPQLAKEWRQFTAHDLPESWEVKIPLFKPADGNQATREASGKVLNSLSAVLPNLIGGSADLAPSNNTLLKGYPDFQKGHYQGRNLHFGVREHVMAAILNGLALHGGIIPYGGTFLIFSDYMRPAIRLAAMMRLHVIYVFTHDSIGLGEDGPTHQPIEQLLSLRAIPQLTVIRPADACETAMAWQVALQHKDGPIALVLTRQKLPVIDQNRYGSAEGLAKGAYILFDNSQNLASLNIILIATGSEVSIALEAAQILGSRGINTRLVSMPSWEIFEKQNQAYKDSVFPPQVSIRISVEAGISLGWEKYTGQKGGIIGIDHFGNSAPYSILMKAFGFTVENIVSRAMDLLKQT